MGPLARAASLCSVLVVAACGGRVDDGHDPPPPPASGADGGAATPGDGHGSTTAAATGECPLPAPRPEYPSCYATMYPPCLVPSDPMLATKIPGLPPSPHGPWVAADPATCAMLCCYGP